MEAPINSTYTCELLRNALLAYVEYAVLLLLALHSQQRVTLEPPLW